MRDSLAGCPLGICTSPWESFHKPLASLCRGCTSYCPPRPSWSSRSQSPGVIVAEDNFEVFINKLFDDSIL